MTGAQFIAETFRGHGVTHVFFVESFLRLTLVEMERLGIRRILTHSEAGAAYMADGYARAGGRPGVCMAQSVGAANLAAGLQDAWLGRSPVIALTGRKPPLAQYRNAYQEIAHAPLFAPVTRYSASIASVEQLPFLLPQAFREATAETPRPVYLEIAGLMGEFIERAEAPLEVTAPTRYMCCPAHRLSPEPAAMAQAVDRLCRAERPVIVAGRGARISSAGEELAGFAEAHAIPLAYSLDGKSLIPDTHPACVGPVGTYSAQCANRVVAGADLVIFVGCDTGDQVTLDWQIPHPKTAVIQLDADATELGRSYPGATSVLGDPKLALRELAQAMPPQQRYDAWLRRAQEIVTEWYAEYEPRRTSNDTPIRVERLCSEIAQHLPADAILLSDTGYSSIWTSTMVRLSSPSQLFLRSAGSLGWAFPASLGAKCVAPERPVVCFTGDGGFYYHLSEMETAVRWNIPTVTIVNNNSALGQCMVPVERVYGDRQGKPGDLTNFTKLNFARIAEAFGCCGIRVEEPAAIGPALDAALASGRPTVIDVVTDPRPRAPAPWSPEQA